MISYYLNILKIKLKYSFTFLYFDLYKSYINIFLAFFDGPKVTFSFFDGENDILLDTFNSEGRTNSVISPFFIFILVNHGFWQVYNLNFWLGSDLISLKPRLTILNNILRKMPLKYNRKRYVSRILSFHLSILERVCFLKLIFLLFLFEIYLNYFFLKNFYFFFILLFYFLIPFFYLQILNIYNYYIKYLSVGIKLIFLKPVSFSLYNKKTVMGDLNQPLLSIEPKFTSYEELYKRQKLYPSFYFNEFYNLNDLQGTAPISSFQSFEKSFLKTTIYRNRFKSLIPISNKGKKKLDYTLFSDFFDIFNGIIYAINLKINTKNSNYFFDYIWRRLYFSKNAYQSFISLFINFNLIRKIAILYFTHLKMLVESENIYIYLKKLFLKCSFFFIIIILYQIYIYIYIYYLFFYNLIFFLLIFFLIIIDYVIYKKNLSNIKSLFLECYIVNYCINYNLEIGLCINSYNKFREYNISDFTMSNYLSLLKIDLNISILESIMNDFHLETEHLYEKKHISFDNDDLDLKNQTLLTKYCTFFDKFDRANTGYAYGSTFKYFNDSFSEDMSFLSKELDLEENILAEKLFDFDNMNEKEQSELLKEIVHHNIKYDEFFDKSCDLYDAYLFYDLKNENKNGGSLGFLNNKMIFNEKKINSCVLSDFNMNQYYYYTKYGVKLIK